MVTGPQTPPLTAGARDASSDGARAPRRTGSHRRHTTRRGSRPSRRPPARAPLPSPLTPQGSWEFAALAHEIRQPLTAILSNAQAAWHVLATDTPDLPEARAALADIIASARRTTEMI